MKVAIVINTSWNIYNYRKGIIEALLNEGHKVIAIAPADAYSEKLKLLGCQYVPIRMDNKGVDPLKDLLLFFRLFMLYKRSKPDFILHYTIKPNVYGTLAATLLRIPCVSNVSGLGTTFIRSGLLWQLVKQLYRFAFRFPKRVFFQNKDDLELFVSLHLTKKSSTGLLPGSGINLMHYPLLSYKRNKPFVFLLIARLLSDKGIKEYALASGLLKKKGYLFQAQLVGFFEQQSKYNISEEELKEWCENGYIEFLGATDEISKTIARADCVVLPSYREGTPRSLLEAMAMGRPIITTNVPGCREVLINDTNGFMCEPQDVESLSKSMEKMLLLTEHELSQMGLSGRKIVEENYIEKIVVDKYFEEIFPNKFTN